MAGAAGPGSPAGPVGGAVAGRALRDDAWGGTGLGGSWAAAPARRRAPGDENRDRAEQRACLS
jgi:hypothetical protein